MHLLPQIAPLLLVLLRLLLTTVRTVRALMIIVALRMEWLLLLPPKNSFMAATTGRMLMREFGVACSESVIVIRSLTTRSMRRRPIRNWFWISSPFARMRRLPRWSMSSPVPRPLFSSISLPMIATMSLRLMIRDSRGFSRPRRAARSSAWRPRRRAPC